MKIFGFEIRAKELRMLSTVCICIIPFMLAGVILIWVREIAEFAALALLCGLILSVIGLYYISDIKIDNCV